MTGPTADGDTADRDQTTATGDTAHRHRAPDDTAYRFSAEFYELVAARQAPSSAPGLRAALTGLDPGAGPLLEIGAGTGAVTRLLADLVPDAAVVATEPSPGMRAILTSRVVRDAELRRRVTVLPNPAQDLPVGLSACAVVLCGVVGHLDRPTRAALWADLRRRLPVGAPIAVELMGVARPRSIPPLRMLRETVGTQVYEWWSSAEPDGADAMAFTSRWRVLRDGHVQREEVETHRWYTLGAPELAAESGMTVSATVAGSPIVVLRP